LIPGQDKLEFYGHSTACYLGSKRRRRLSRDHRTKAAGSRQTGSSKDLGHSDTNKPEVVEEQDEEEAADARKFFGVL
jgi:hypothetical protein